MTRNNQRRHPATNGRSKAGQVRSYSPIRSASSDQPIYRQFFDRLMTLVLSPFPDQQWLPVVPVVTIILLLAGSLFPTRNLSLLLTNEWKHKKWESAGSQDTIEQSFDGSIQLDSSQLPAKAFELKIDHRRTLFSAPPGCLAGDLLAGTHNVTAYHFLISFNSDGSMRMAIFCKGMKNCHLEITFKCAG